LKACRTRRKNAIEKMKIGGRMRTDTIVIRTSVTSMRGIGTAIMITARPISTTCVARNCRTVSTSEVQRWTWSPVSALSWYAQGTCWSWS
jgi:hypothetical protein